jgi:hypothetical protein
MQQWCWQSLFSPLSPVTFGWAEGQARTFVVKWLRLRISGLLGPPFVSFAPFAVKTADGSKLSEQRVAANIYSVSSFASCSFFWLRPYGRAVLQTHENSFS